MVRVCEEVDLFHPERCVKDLHKRLHSFEVRICESRIFEKILNLGS